MNKVEFQNYLHTLIVPLYQDACDKPGFRVAVMVGSGPGRMSLITLVKMRARGYYILPSPSNTTHVTLPT